MKDLGNTATQFLELHKTDGVSKNLWSIFSVPLLESHRQRDTAFIGENPTPTR